MPFGVRMKQATPYACIAAESADGTVVSNLGGSVKGPEDGPQARPQWSRRPQAALELVEKLLTECGADGALIAEQLSEEQQAQRETLDQSGHMDPSGFPWAGLSAQVV